MQSQYTFKNALYLQSRCSETFIARNITLGFHKWHYNNRVAVHKWFRFHYEIFTLFCSGRHATLVSGSDVLFSHNPIPAVFHQAATWTEHMQWWGRWSCGLGKVSKNVYIFLNKIFFTWPSMDLRQLFTPAICWRKSKERQGPCSAGKNKTKQPPSMCCCYRQHLLLPALKMSLPAPLPTLLPSHPQGLPSATFPPPLQHWGVAALLIGLQPFELMVLKSTTQQHPFLKCHCRMYGRRPGVLLP